MPDSHIVQKILTELQESILSDQIVLPTLPEIALKTQQITEDPDAVIKDVVEVVQIDAAISARLIKVANSPLVRTSSPVNNISTAIMRLGLSFSCNLITGLAIEQLFEAQSPIIDEKLHSVCRLSAATAGRATVLARHFSKISPDEAALAGLVHLIGTLPVLTFLDEKPIDEGCMTHVEALMSELHADLGCQILQSWGFRETMLNIPAVATDYLRDENDSPDHGDVVIMARLLTLASEGQLTEDIPPLQDIPLFKRVGIEFKDDSGTSPQLEPLKEEFETSIQAFSV